MLLTVDEVMDWVPQASADTALIEDAIRQATSLASTYCRRRLAAAEYDHRFTTVPEQPDIDLRQYPVTAVAAVIVDPDGSPITLTETDDYMVDSESGLLVRTNGYWEVGRRWIRVQYTAGYVPEDLAEGGVAEGLRQPLLELVAWRLGFRGGAGVARQSVDGVTTEREGMVRGIPEGIAGLLEDFERIV